MKNKETLIRFSQARSDLYRFLGVMYIMEVDEEQLTALKQMTFPVITGDSDADLDLKEGYALILDYVAGISSADLEDLAADYARVFLAAGDAAGRAAFPYESVYVDKKHQVGGSTGMQMKALYLDRGLEPDPNVYRTMYDNIGLILEFMGNICDEITGSLEAENTKSVSLLLQLQRQILEDHITNWVYSFTSDIIKFADYDFYKGIAKITNGFIKKETMLLKEGAKAWGIE